MRVMKEAAEAIDGREVETNLGAWQLFVTEIEKGRIFVTLEQSGRQKEVRIRFDKQVWNEDRIWGVDWDGFADWVIPKLAARVNQGIQQEPVELFVCEEGLEESR